jgi:hypothetical protein
VGSFVVDWTEQAAVPVATLGVVPSLNPLEDGTGELAALPAVLIEQLELKGAEEALGDAVESKQSPIVPMDPSRPAPRRRRPKTHDV